MRAALTAVGLASLTVSLMLSVATGPSEAARTGAAQTPSAVGSPVRLMATPPAVLRTCRSSSLLRSACPRRLPYVAHLSSEPAYEFGLCRIGRTGCGGLTWDDLELQHAGPGSHPPVWAHISVAAGHILGSQASLFPWPKSRTPTPLRNGLFGRDRPTALFLGQVRFGKRSGTLVLAPSYPAGGMVGDHLIFYWKTNAVDHMISLHGWEPFLQLVATLRAMVDSTDAASATK
jgi:hypothetical protein